MFVVADTVRFDTSRPIRSFCDSRSRGENASRASRPHSPRTWRSIFESRSSSQKTSYRVEHNGSLSPNFALGRFRPFFKDAGRSYRRQVGSRQPPDRPAGGVGRAFPSIRLPIVIWFPPLLQPIDSILGTTSDSCLSTHFNAKTRQSGSMDLQGLATPSRKLASRRLPPT